MTKNGFKQLKSIETTSNKGLKTYIAMLTRARKDINTACPTVLLSGIISDDEEFRDHCWVKESKALRKLFINTTKSIIIEFRAKEKQYDYRNTGVIKKTLESITDIKVLG